MTMVAPEINAQVTEISATVACRLDEMVEQVTASIRANVAFYRDTGASGVCFRPFAPTFSLVSA